MKFFTRLLLTFFFINLYFSANAEINVRYLNLDYILQNSIVGKKISKKAQDIRKSKINEFKKIEEDLSNKKDNILSKKNILDKKQFDIEVSKHQENVKKYHTKKKKELNELNKKNAEMINNFMKKIDEVLKKYVKDNSIDLIYKQEAILVSSAKFDITKDILDEVNNKIKKID